MDTEERRAAIRKQIAAIDGSPRGGLRFLRHALREGDRTYNLLNWYDRELNYMGFGRLDGLDAGFERWRERRAENIVDLYALGVLDEAMLRTMQEIDGLLNRLVKRWWLLARLLRWAGRRGVRVSESLRLNCRAHP